MLDKYGWIKEMNLEEYSNDDGYFVLEFNQTPFGDLAIISKLYEDNGIKHKTGYKSTYFSDSSEDNELLAINIDKAKDWFYEVMKINK